MGGHEGVYHQFAPLPNPTGMTHFAGPISVAESLLNIGLLLIILTCGAGLLSRFRRAGSEEREQLKWFLYVIALVCVDIVVAIPVGAVIHSHWVGDIEWILGAYAVAFGLPVGTPIAVPNTASTTSTWSSTSRSCSEPWRHSSRRSTSPSSSASADCSAAGAGLTSC